MKKMSSYVITAFNAAYIKLTLLFNDIDMIEFILIIKSLLSFNETSSNSHTAYNVMCEILKTFIKTHKFIILYVYDLININYD